MKERKIVIIGGGHGQGMICRGVKQIPNVQISAIVTVADDGGSTGRLRRQFHIPAMGDIRNVMTALSAEESMMNSLMNFRFEDPDGTGMDVQGHNLGNLILTAMTKQCGSFLEAVTMIGKVLNVRGTIIPATTQVIELYARMDDGVIVRGEANIPNVSNHIRQVFYDCKVQATPAAVEAIEQADLIIYGIGSVYTSILPNVIIPDIRRALAKTAARRIYFCNAMTQPGETDGYSMEDHVQALLEHGAKVDGVVMADDSIPEAIVQRYKSQGSIPVHRRESEHAYAIYPCSLLRFENGLIRHDPQKIQAAVNRLLENICHLPKM